jgi:hypothetical protein
MRFSAERWVDDRLLRLPREGDALARDDYNDLELLGIATFWLCPGIIRFCTKIHS